MTRLPRSTDDLRGLRAARWVRESTERQGDRYGPDAQREQQDVAMDRYGLVDSGLAWNVQHSGRTVATTDQWAQMMAAAGQAYDVLLVGYVSRFARDLRTAVNARHDLHAAGAAILFADERVLSSDEDAWEQWARETVEAEAYSRRLAKRIREGYAAKFRRHGDQAGPAPLGFVRTGPDSILSIDPDTIAQPVAIFTRYATGLVSYDELGAEHGMEAGAIREILRNPVYNGWVRRHCRTAVEQRQPAPWRDDPPVSDALWARVATIKASRTRSSGKRALGTQAPVLSGLLWCPCGLRIRSNGSQGSPPHPMVIHPTRECEEWGDRRTWPMGWYEDAIGAQVEGIAIDDVTIAAVVATLAGPSPVVVPVETLETRRRRKALDAVHASGDMSEAAYRAALARLVQEQVSEPRSEAIDAAEVVERLRALPAMWRRSGQQERRGLALSIFDRIEVAGQSFTGARLTPAALALGLDVALPQVVRVSRGGNGPSRAIVRVPVIGHRSARRILRSA